jgi:hypothetical protein
MFFIEPVHKEYWIKGVENSDKRIKYQVSNDKLYY